MKSFIHTTEARHCLDSRFAEIGAAEHFTPPVRGWIKALREALGMSSQQLARRLAISQPSLAAMERSEAKGTAQLRSLRRVAAALDCQLVYALVPNKPLDTMLRERVRQVARQRLPAVAHTMLLEQQSLPPEDDEAQLAAYGRFLDPRKLWDELMMGLFEEPDSAATPLTAEETKGLIPSHIALRRELNAAEQANILRGQEWALRDRRPDILTEAFITELHRRMFGEVWRWAGTFRMTERNIGIDAWKIPVELRILLDDARLWVAKTVFPPDEIAVRLHHRLVAIHPFPNGNGRHARLVADLLVLKLGRPRFPWGRGVLTTPGDLRRRYIDALRQADVHEIGPLLAFARASEHE